VSLILASILGGIADNCANTGSCRASDEASLKSSADYGTENCAASASDERAFAGADTAAVVVVPLVITVVGVTRIIVLSAMAALADAVIKVLVPVRLLISVIAAIIATILISLVAAAVLTTIRLMALLRERRHRREQQSDRKGSCFHP
jgi:uncharacterized protein (DUF983 family)